MTKTDSVAAGQGAVTKRCFRLAVTLSLLLLCPMKGNAHPVPKDNHDRALIVRLTPDAVVVDYRLEVDEARAVLDLPKRALAGVTSRRDIHAAFARHSAQALAARSPGIASQNASRPGSPCRRCASRQAS